MEGQDPRPSLKEAGLSPEEFEHQIGGAAVTIVEYLIAGLRWVNGEGREDKVVDPIVKTVLGAVVPHMQARLQANERLMLSFMLNDLTALYRLYQEQKIAGREQLREHVKALFSSWQLKLTDGQASMLAPDPVDVSQHGGATPFARHVIGRLFQVSSSTIRNWDTKAEKQLNSSDEKLLPYGIRVTPQEVCDFIKKHALSTDPAPVISHIVSATDEARRLRDGVDEAARSAARQPSVGAGHPPQRVRSPGRPPKKRPR